MNDLCITKTQETADKTAETGLLDVYVEFLRHPDNWIFISLALASLGWLMADGPTPYDVLWFTLGWACFLPQEYFTHLLLLHRRLPKSQRCYQVFYRLHYGHHDLPRRHDLMYMPAWLTLPMTLANVLLLGLITPTFHAHVAAFVGAVWGYLFYEWCHLLFHTPYLPRSAVWQKLRQRHLMHHFYNERHWLSVAPLSVVVDRLMGSQNPAQRSPSCRYLGLSAEHQWVLTARQRFAHRTSGSVEASRLWRRHRPHPAHGRGVATHQQEAAR